MATSESTESALQALRDGALAGTWILDPAESQIGLRTKSMWGLAKVNGVFGQVAGEVVITQAGEASGTITVDATSLDTKNKKRDDHLRSADFLEVTKHPNFIFSLNDVRPAAEGVTVVGTLTVHGQTQPLLLDATLASFHGHEVRLDATVAINRGDFGIGWNKMGSSLDNVITVHAVFAKGS